jgi:hypothetical protein
MGRVWSVDAVAKNASTSFYGNIVALDESPLRSGLLAVGTDDGLIQISEDGGAQWRRIDKFPGVPERTYVSRVLLSRHDPAVIYAAFDAHKAADFKPYVLRSADLGRSWSPVAGGLPERGTVYAMAEDGVRKDLLFAGSEFGLFVTFDAGQRWLQLKGGLPTIQVRDLAIQRRENDLVAATFGRGFYVLDDYTPLRAVTPALLDQEAALFAPRPAVAYVPSIPLGYPGKAFMGDSYYVADNPPFGAVFTWYLKDELRGRKKARQEREKEVAKKGGDTPYPSWEALRAEDREEEPGLVLLVTDAAGNLVRRIAGPTAAGFQRAAWDLRYPALVPTVAKPPELDPWDRPPEGPMAAPGTYRAQLARRGDGGFQPLGQPVSFEARPPLPGSLPAPDRAALLAFQERTGRLQRAVLGAAKAAEELSGHVDLLRPALDETLRADPRLRLELAALEGRLKDLQAELLGDSTVARRNEPTPEGILSRVQRVVDGQWHTTADATGTERQGYQQAAALFGPWLARFRTLAADLARLEAAAEAAGAPWTPGRIPEWRPE